MSKDKPENHHNTNFALYTLVLTFFANIPNFLENTRDFFIGVLIIIGNFNPINIYRTISNPSLVATIVSIRFRLSAPSLKLLSKIQ